MTFLEPLWLLLAVPLAFLLRRWPPPSGWMRFLRYGFCAVLLLTLSRPALWLPQGDGAVVVLVDRSASMPDDGEALATEVIRRLESSRRAGDGISVLSFGAEVGVESSADGSGFAGFQAAVGDQQSRLGQAIERGLALLPEAGQGRLLVLSDGRHTDPDLAPAIGLANLQNVAVDYHLIERPAVSDLALARLDVPLQVSPGEGFLLTAWVESPWPQEVSYELWRGEQRVTHGQRRLPRGRSRLTFRDRAQGPGIQAYRLRIQGQSPDAVPQNDVARFLVSVRGPRPILHLRQRGGGALAPLLRAGGLEVESALPGRLSGQLEELAGFSALILEDISAEDLGDATMAQIAAWVRETGAGLMVTGGRRSYGVGGYYRSPLEEALPVSMELRQEHRKIPLAIVVALDRSGSMSATAGDGLDKMDLANRATVEVLDLLQPMDELAVIAVDSAPYVVQELRPVTETSRMRQDILEIDAMGGGIYVYEALIAATQQLKDSTAPIRHILLFADANDAEEPGAYRELIARCRDVGISISVVGLGTPQDADANLLREIAGLGDGQVFFTESAHALPRLFAQDTFLVSRGAFLEGETKVRLTAGFELLTGQRLSPPPVIGGYNLTYLRPEAQWVGTTEDDQQAPWIASWTYGLGRVVAMTSEIDGTSTGPVAAWQDLGQMLTGLVRWTAGSADELGDAVLTQELRGDALSMEIHLDPESSASAVGSASWRALRGIPGATPETTDGEFRWRDPHTLEAELDLRGDEVAWATVTLADGSEATLPPARLPYSSEFRPRGGGEGHRALERMARGTGGRQRFDIGGIWRSFPRQRQARELTPWLLWLAALLLLLEVVERRGQWLSQMAGDWRRGRTSVGSVSSSGKVADEKAVKPKDGARGEPRKQRRPAARPQAVDEVTSVDGPQVDPAGLASALGQARRRADRRQRRR